MAADLITRIRGYSLQSADIITKVRGRSGISLTVDAGDDRTLEPFESITLTAASSGQPGDWQWEQVDGQPVLLYGTGASRTYTTPATPEGTVLVFRVTASQGTTPATDTVTHTIYPHTIWRGDAPVYIPA